MSYSRDLKYDAEHNRIIGTDKGGVPVLRGIPYGWDAEEIHGNGFMYAGAWRLLEAVELFLLLHHRYPVEAGGDVTLQEYEEAVREMRRAAKMMRGDGDA